MCKIVDEIEEVFEFFLDVASGVRTNELDIEDRFTRLTLGQEEITPSAIFGLTFEARQDDLAKIDIKPVNDFKKVLSLSFQTRGEEKYFKCLSLEDYRTLRVVNLDNSMDLVDHALTHFKNLLKFYQKSIKSIMIIGRFVHPRLKKFDFEIESFESLEKLMTLHGFYVENLILKVPHPLKYLSTFKKVREHCEQMYQAERLRLPHVAFTNEQFLRLSAVNMSIAIGELTEEDVYNFIRSWQNGQLQRKLECCEWSLYQSNFDYRQFFGYFGPEAQRNLRVMINHNTEAGKKAKLNYDRGCLVFRTTDSPQQ